MEREASEVRLPELPIFKKYSLAVRQEFADARDVLSVLERTTSRINALLEEAEEEQKAEEEAERKEAEAVEAEREEDAEELDAGEEEGVAAQPDEVEGVTGEEERSYEEPMGVTSDEPSPPKARAKPGPKAKPKRRPKPRPTVVRISDILEAEKPARKKASRKKSSKKKPTKGTAKKTSKGTSRKGGSRGKKKG